MLRCNGLFPQTGAQGWTCPPYRNKVTWLECGARIRRIWHPDQGYPPVQLGIFGRHGIRDPVHGGHPEFHRSDYLSVSLRRLRDR